MTFADHKRAPKLAPGDPGRDKFTELNKPVVPPAIDTWKTALANVNRHSPVIHDQYNGTDLAYLFPEAAGLAVIHGKPKFAAMMKTWLRYRSAIIYRMTHSNSDAKPMAQQAWKTLLLLDWLRPTPGTKNDTRVNDLKDFLQSCLDVDGVTAAAGTETTIEPSWRGKMASQLVDSDYQEILWEVNELNFRFELMALDSRLSSDAGNPHRQRLIEACFPGCSTGNLLVVDLEKANHGLAHDSVDERSLYIQALRKVMQSWELKLPPLVAADHKAAWREAEFNELEREMTGFYVQTFYDIFHRAATIPRHLPHYISPFIPPPRTYIMLNPRPKIVYDLSVLDLPSTASP